MPKPAAKGHSLEMFRKTYDKKTVIPAKIKAGLAQLGESWEYEGDFVKRCGISVTEFSQYREPFAHHCVELPRRGGLQSKRAWCGSTGFANKLREMV